MPGAAGNIDAKHRTASADSCGPRRISGIVENDHPERAEVLRIDSHVATTRIEFLGPDGKWLPTGARA